MHISHISKAFHLRVVTCMGSCSCVKILWSHRVTRVDFAVFQDEKRKHDSESREHRDLKGSGEEVRHHRGDRERAERDKQKERRHREEEEPERNHHRDRTSSKKSDKSHGHETKTEVCMPVWCLYAVTCRCFYFLFMVL